MNVITKPCVKLIAKQQIVQNQLDDWLDANGFPEWRPVGENSAAEYAVEVSGRVCYLSFEKPRPGGNKAYIEHIKEVGHGSVLEHTAFTFLVSGVSRTFSHELVRHRAGWAYSQLSQRYVDESQAEYVCPQIIYEDDELKRHWWAIVELTHNGYVKLSDLLNVKLQAKSYRDRWLLPDAKTTDIRKTARQAARSVLPNATETKLSVTVNARALRHFLEMRGSRFAEPEIRAAAFEMFQVALADSPHLFSDYTADRLPDGTYELTTPFRKV